MTRKRFIKLLMSNGEQRNKAQAIAMLYNVSKISYKRAYSDYLLKSGVKKSFVRLGEACRKASESLCGLVRSFDALKQILVISNEHKQIYDGTEKKCTDCRYFVGCECFDGKTCDLFERKTENTK